MKRLLALLLVIGALSGLFGAQMAAAHSVPQAAGAPLAKGMDAVSYTHLTLPTIYSV